MKNSAKRPSVGQRLAPLVIAGLLTAVLTPLGMTAEGPCVGDPPAGAAGQSGQLPPVPKEAQDAFFRAHDIIDMLTKRPDQAAGSSEWDVVIKRLMEAQSLAPTAPQILRDLGLAHQLRGRASAAVAWFKAASHAIRRYDASSPELGELAKRIATLTEVPQNQMELALTFAREEIPYMHAKKLPNIGPKGDLWPPQATAPLGPVVVDLSNNEWTRNPDLFNKDGSPKVQDVPRKQLEMSLIKFRLGIGDTSAIEEAEAYFRANGEPSDPLTWSLVRLNAYKLCLESLIEAEAWPEVARLAEEAADWCEQVRTAWTAGQAQQFRQTSREMSEAVAGIRTDKTTQWMELARELAGSDDEVYFQAKIDNLQRMTQKGEALLEGIAQAVEPIARNLMRLRSIAD